MTITVIKPDQITVPATTPLQGTLLDVATIVESVNYLQPNALYESFNCITTDSVAVLPCPAAASPKTFGNLSWNDGISFAAYAGVQCGSVGYDREHAESEVRRVFEAKESNAVEAALLKYRFVAGPDDDPGAGVDLEWNAAVDLTPAGGAVDPKVGLAILEGDAAIHYAGVPTVHVPRSIGSLLFDAQALMHSGNMFVSHQGSKIASGGGYETSTGPTGAAAAAGEKWIYGTGEVTVARAELFYHTELDRSTNVVYTLVERLYVATIDCYASAIRVKVQ